MEIYLFVLGVFVTGLVIASVFFVNEEEKKKYYDLYLWIKSQGNFKHLEVRLAEDYDLGDERIRHWTRRATMLPSLAPARSSRPAHRSI